MRVIYDLNAMADSTFTRTIRVAFIIRVIGRIRYSTQTTCCNLSIIRVSYW